MRRALRSVLFVSASVTVGACAALLGIDDRLPLLDDADGAAEGGPPSEGGGDGGSDTDAPAEGSVDGGSDAEVVVCDPTACGDAGGTCGAMGCTLACGASDCDDRTFACPPGNDCWMQCDKDESCTKLKCAGGRSCTFDCSGTRSCKEGITCESERCDIRCTGTQDSCKSGGAGFPVVCTAAVCKVLCAGEEACTKGVTANATSTCDITCTGSTTSCNAGAVSCGSSPSSRIVCVPDGGTTCAMGKPTCRGGTTCSITCGGASCGDGVCCEAGTCTLDPAGIAAQNVCP